MNNKGLSADRPKHKLLRLPEKNPRTPISQLASRIGMSNPCGERAAVSTGGDRSPESLSDGTEPQGTGVPGHSIRAYSMVDGRNMLVDAAYTPKKRGPYKKKTGMS